MLRNILYLSLSILLFFIGVILYGIILNLREDTLVEAMAKKGLTELNNVEIVVDRSNYRLELYSDKELIKSYRASFGKNSSPVKTSKDDLITPTGEYEICRMDTISEYHSKLLLNYPNEKDAAESLKNNVIGKKEFDKIVHSWKTKNCPPKNTKLSVEIGIHGIGDNDFIFRNLPFAFNWTNGSVALSNKSMDELFSVVQLGTKVIIRR